MDYLLLLSQDFLDLARTEAITVLKPSETKFSHKFIITKDIDFNQSSKLAYTKQVMKILFTSTIDNINTDLNNFDFSTFNGSFSVKACHGLNVREKEFADIIWNRLKDVDLKNAKNKFYFYEIEDKVYFTLLLHQNNENFLSRRSHLRPGKTGNSLHPKLARCLVNLLDSNKILDPFCGTGGLLIEAGLMGLDIKGYDINEIALKKARLNFEHFKIKGEVQNKDATKVKLNNVVCDLPYGKSSKLSTNLDKLYIDFFSNLKNNDFVRGVIVMPDFVDYNKYLKDFKIVNKFNIFIHKSLSKLIFILE